MSRLQASAKQLKQHFDAGGNVLRLVRDSQGSDENTIDGILAAYDLQAGGYVEAMKQATTNRSITDYAKAIARLFDELEPKTILEAGVGEATTLTHVIENLSRPPRVASGFDISWSRLAHARQYSSQRDVAADLFLGDLFAIPVVDNAFDVVYTSHSIEPNRGREAEALAELFRVARRFVVLLEPASSFGNPQTKARIQEHRYCIDLTLHAQSLGLNVVEHRLFDVCTSDCNQTELMVIEKEASPHGSDVWYACPCCHMSLVDHQESFFCRDCYHVYPRVGGIPCLTDQSAVFASQYLAF